MFKIEEHESNISDLSTLLKVEGVDQAKASLILQKLRDNYTEVNTSITDSTKQIEKFKETNEGLRSANMEILSKLGAQFSNNKPPESPKPETQPEGGQVLTLDEITKNFI